MKTIMPVSEFLKHEVNEDVKLFLNNNYHSIIIMSFISIHPVLSRLNSKCLKQTSLKAQHKDI